MKRSGKWQIFWRLVTEDRDLFFFLLVGMGLLVSILLSVRTEGMAVFSSRSLANIISFLFCVVGVLFYFNKYRKTAANVVGQKHIPIVVVTGKTMRDARQMLETAQEAITQKTGFKEFKSVEDFFNVSFEEILIHQDDNLNPHDPARWKFFIERIQREVRQFSDRVSGDKVYHLFIFGIGVTALAIGLGAVFGTRSKIIVYQPSGQGGWEPVLDLSHDIRRIKGIPQEVSYQYIRVSLPEQPGSEVALILNMASHPATGFVQRYLKERNLAGVTLVQVDNTYQGNLQEKDWAPVVQELFSTYSQIHREGPSQIHLFHNMPTAMAFGLGVAMGIYNKVIVYCWDLKTESYSPVFSLNELEALV